MEESAATLQAKVEMYRQQATQLVAALLMDPTNSDLLKLQSDVNEALTLTTDLLTYQLEQEGAVVVEAPRRKPPPQPTGPVQVEEGAYVAAFFSGENSYCNAIVTRLKPSGTAMVRFVGYNNTETEVEKLALRHPIEPDETLLVPGAFCRAVYSADGQWYDANVDSVSEDFQFTVTYHGYGNSETVHRFCVKLPPMEVIQEQEEEAVKNLGKGKNKRPAPSGKESTGMLAIPENLKILPGDSEEIRKAKKKKVHAIKSKNRMTVVENARNARQANWQSFRTKSKTSKGKGTLFRAGSRKGESIFATADNPEAKVGVTGSGQGVTHYQGPQRFTLTVDEVSD